MRTNVEVFCFEIRCIVQWIMSLHFHSFQARENEKNEIKFSINFDWIAHDTFSVSQKWNEKSPKTKQFKMISDFLLFLLSTNRNIFSSVLWSVFFVCHFVHSKIRNSIIIAEIVHEKQSTIFLKYPYEQIDICFSHFRFISWCKFQMRNWIYMQISRRMLARCQMTKLKLLFMHLLCYGMNAILAKFLFEFENFRFVENRFLSLDFDLPEFLFNFWLNDKTFSINFNLIWLIN